MGARRPRGRPEGGALIADAAGGDASSGTRPDGAPWLNFHGRRSGKTLRARQRTLLETRLDALSPLGDAPVIDPAALFPGATELWLEIGFGGGEHLIATAAAHRHVGFIGCEPFMNGVAQFLSALEDSALTNVRVHADDARQVLRRLAPGALGRVHLLYPDPWPKRRHAARRFVNPPNLDLLAPAMRPGAELRLATDVADYAAHARAVLGARGDFAADTDGPTPWGGWPGTRYEAKALRAGRAPCYQIWRRV